MRFYVTKFSNEKIKESFLNVKSFFIIDVKELLESLQFIKNKNYFEFLTNEEIKNKIIEATEKKRYNNIIYINEDIDINIIENLKDVLKEIIHINKFIFIDEDEQQDKKLYPLFDEIIFFPKQKKVRIIECEYIKNPLYYWINNCPIPEELKKQQ